MIPKCTAKYSKDICDTLLNLWESGSRKEEDKWKEMFERKKDWYLNNATTKFRNKDRDKSNPEQKEKHWKTTIRSPNSGKHEKRIRNTRRSEGRNGNTKSSK